MIGGTTALVGLLRDPKVGSLSPRMQNAAFAALALDVAYVPLGVAPEQLEDAVRGMVAMGFLGANVTTPHKLAVVALCDEVEGAVESVNTLVIRDGRVLGSSTDTAALGDVGRDAPPWSVPAVQPQRGSRSWSHAPCTSRSSPARATGRRDTDDAELVVHATPVKDELLFGPRPGQTVIDLAYRAEGGETAHAAAAVAAGASSSTGSTCSSRRAPRRSSAGPECQPRLT